MSAKEENMETVELKSVSVGVSQSIISKVALDADAATVPASFLLDVTKAARTDPLFERLAYHRGQSTSGLDLLWEDSASQEEKDGVVPFKLQEVHDMALLADAAYENWGVETKGSATKEEMTEHLGKLGYELVPVEGGDSKQGAVHVNESEFFCAVERKSRRVVLSFRGTSSMEDVQTDVHGICGTCCRSDEESFKRAEALHVGFDAAFEHIRPMVHKALDAAKEVLGASEQAPATLVMTGHSLGGALATIATCYVGCLVKHPASAPAYSWVAGPGVDMITFGAPRVADKSWTLLLREVAPRSVRVVNGFDVVARVPAAYNHAANLLYIVHDRQYLEKYCFCGGGPGNCGGKRVYYNPPDLQLILQVLVYLMANVLLPSIICVLIVGALLYIIVNGGGTDNPQNKAGFIATAIIIDICIIAFFCYSAYKRSLSAHVTPRYIDAIKARIDEGEEIFRRDASRRAGACAVQSLCCFACVGMLVCVSLLGLLWFLYFSGENEAYCGRDDC